MQTPEKLFDEHRLSKKQMLGIVLKETLLLRGPVALLRLYAYYIVNYIYGRRVAQIGRNTNIRPTVMLREPRNIVIGDNCRFNNNCILNGGHGTAKLRFGNNVLVGPNVAFYVANHNHTDPDTPIKDAGYIEQDIIVDDDVWIGANSVITSGVHIGRGAVIGAGSVVTHDIPPYAVACGTPARIVKQR